MNRSKVFFKKFNSIDDSDNIESIIKDLFYKSALNEVITSGDITAIKVHFGEEGNSTFLPAAYTKSVVDILNNLQSKPFVTDTNVLYKSKRDNSIDHITLANNHGFSFEKIGAPIIIADGINGQNENEVEINAPMNKKVAIASDFISADSIIVISHATGHLATGLGATIKNLGMGMASKKGKLRQHSVSKPHIIESICSACGKCLDWCPVDAINIDDYAKIDQVKCIGCGECLAVCNTDAVGFKWDASSELLQKQIAEHALGITSIKKKKIGYLTFLIQMTKDCDCLPQKKQFILDDIGILAGFDPVAIDQAVLDLTERNDGLNIANLSYPKYNPSIQLEYGEKINLGNRKYNLIEV